MQRWVVNIRMWTPSESLFYAFVDVLPVSERSHVLRFDILQFSVGREIVLERTTLSLSIFFSRIIGCAVFVDG